MKLEILKENLEKAVSIASKVSNKNLSLPVFGCVLIVVEGGKAILRATNLDLSVEVTLKAKTTQDGVIAVPAHVLAQTVSALTDQKLLLKTSGNNLIIDGERGTTSITLIDPTEFPTLPFVKDGEGVSVVLPVREFTSALKAVSFSASTSSVKPELSSISLSLEKGELIAVATDSFRLAEVRIPIKTKGSFSSILLPARNVVDILRAIESGVDVEVRVDDNQCSFISDFGHITSRTIDGAFPDYKAIIPREYVAEATCLKEDAARAFRKISIFTDSFNQVHISLKSSEKTFTVRAVNASVGETVDHIPAALTGEDIDINFNARYIVDALSVMGGDSVTFSIAGAGKPMVMSDTAGKDFTYLVMPMNR